MASRWQFHWAARITGAVTAIGVVAGAAHAGPDTPDPALVRSSIYVPVRDGTKLAVNIYRPAEGGVARDGHFPIVFAFTPYRARYFKDGKIVDMVDQPVFGLRDLVHAGYVVATADVRGKGASFGARRGFLDRTEAHDGYDLIQWLAAKPWSSGKVGIVGCSYLGGSAMLVAGTLPPALRAVFAGATDIDKYNFVRQGGITAQFNTRPDEPPEVDLASVPVDGDTDGALLKAAVAQHAGNTPMAKLWESMPYRDSVSPLTHNRFWAEVGPYTHLAALRSKQLAWYLWDNWEDEPTEQMIMAAGNLDTRLIIGPGSHCVPPPASAFSITGEERRFFDHYLKGIDNGIERGPHYAWFHEGANGAGTMVRSATLPGVGVARTSFYLSSRPNDAPAAFDTGSLSLVRPVAGKAPFKVDYDLGTGEYFAFWPAVLDGKGLTYTSAPLAADVGMTGYPLARISAALDRADANLFAYLEDVAPDGKVHMVSFSRLAASHRKLATPPYQRLGLPYHSGLKADVAPMIPGKPADFVMAMSPRAYTFAAGHRVRVTLTGADPRQRNLAQIRQDPPPVFTVVQGGAAASRVDIPFTTKPTFR
jgi:predicted acyl esterase